MSKRVSKAQRAKNLVAKGYSNKYIFEHFPYVPKQAVYTARWLANKEKGLATLPKPEAVGQGTGITSSATTLDFEIIDHPNDKHVVKASNKRRNAQLARRNRERLEREAREAMENKLINLYPRGNFGITYQQPLKPTLWQRIKGFFVGA